MSKKTVELIIRSGNDYVIAVKANQPSLYKQIQNINKFKQLHWAKDMVFCEDRSRIRTLDAPANLSIIRTIAINLLRRHGYTSLTNAIRRLAHDLDGIFLLFEALA